MEDIVGIVLHNWTGLKMSIDHGMGGSNPSVADKVACLIKSIMEKLYCTNTSWEDISDILEDVMDVEFNTILEDNSTDEVAQAICELYILWKAGESSIPVLNDRLNKMPVKTPLQALYHLPPPQHPVQETDSAGNVYVVEEASDNEWITVKHRR